MSWASFSCSHEHMLTVSSVWVFLFYKSPISPEMGSAWAWDRNHGLFCMPTLPVCTARLIYIIFLNEACAKDVGYITSQTGRHIHGRLVKGLWASAARRNPCNRIFWGMREGVGGKQQGEGRCGKRYDPFLHLSWGHYYTAQPCATQLTVTWDTFPACSRSPVISWACSRWAQLTQKKKKRNL